MDARLFVHVSFIDQNWPPALRKTPDGPVVRGLTAGLTG